MELRSYQKDAIKAYYNHVRAGENSPALIVHATGLGKSVIIGHIAGALAKKGKPVLILAHAKELLQQNYEKITSYIPKKYIGIYSAGLGEKSLDKIITVASIQSIHKKADKIHPPSLVIIDEAHLLSPDNKTMYQTFLNTLWQKKTSMQLLGLTATPYRLKGGNLINEKNSLFKTIAHEYGIKEGIKNQWLCPIHSKITTNQISTDNIRTTAGEFNQHDLEKAFMGDETKRALKDMLVYAKDRKSILIFATTIAHAHEIKNILKENTEIITGNTNDTERNAIIQDFKNQKIRFLVNVNVLTTGFDAPNVDCVVLLRATKSAGLYVQMIGRSTRPHPNKTNALILDYGGNIERLGPVDDIMLPKHPKNKKTKSATKIKICQKCKEAVHISKRKCPACGFEFPMKIEVKASELDIINQQNIKEISIKTWGWYKHIAKKTGNTCLKVVYFPENILEEHVTEYLILESNNQFLYKTWCDILNLKKQKNIVDALNYFKTERPLPPLSITIKKCGKYNKIIKYKIRAGLINPALI